MVIPEPIQEVQENDIPVNEAESNDTEPLFDDISNDELDAMIDSCF